MAAGIGVYVEHWAGQVQQVTAELITAARSIKAQTKEPVQAIVVAQQCSLLEEQLKTMGFDEVYMVNAGRDITGQDDAVSQAVAEMIKEIDPSIVLVPASPDARSLFSRVAVILGCGLTADCTELLVEQREDKSFYIRQNKPSFGENIMASIITKREHYPQMMTIRQGVYDAYVCDDDAKPEWKTLDISVPPSCVEFLEMAEVDTGSEDILSADIVVVAGKGALEGENYQLVKQFANKIGAVMACTRPLVDLELAPFETQIGQTGCTIRPKICISFGVSGAIQHTEGIKDTKLFIAINSDKHAPIFGIANYGVAREMEGVLKYM